MNNQLEELQALFQQEPEPVPESVEPPESENSKTGEKPRRRGAKIVLIALLGMISIVIATIIFSMIAMVVAPQKFTETFGPIKVAAESKVIEVMNLTPKITLYGSGGEKELDACTGTFIEITDYQADDRLQPVWSAHNYCGGDTILPLSPGDTLDIYNAHTGITQEYRVVDMRLSGYYTTTTEDLVGMAGDFIIQSCHYDWVNMRFLGVEPVESI